MVRGHFFLCISQVNQLDSQAAQNIKTVGTLYVMKSGLLKDVIVDSIYKSKDDSGTVAAQQREDLFPEVRKQIMQ